MNILIVKLSAIGDVIHTLPALSTIRRHYPKAHITWLVESAAADLVVGHKALDRVIICRRKQWIRQFKGSGRWRAIAEMRAFWQDLRDTRYDLVIDFQALLKSGLLVWMTKADRKIGFDRGMAHQEHSYLFLNERIPPVDMEVHALTRGLMLLDAIGLKESSIAYDIPVSEEDRCKVKQLLTRHGLGDEQPLVAVNPVALWETKLWSNDRFAVLADHLIQENRVGVVFTGAAADRPIVASILARMTLPAANLAGHTSLKMLAALYEQSMLLITTDTGPMHLAAAVGTPVAALFGPTAPWRTGPFGDHHQVIRTAPPCSPCFKRRCDDHQCRCMRDITEADVFQAAQRMLAAVNPRSAIG